MKPSELLNSPEKWIKGKLALDREGRSVPYDSGMAVSWCMLGALYYCNCAIGIETLKIRGLIIDRYPHRLEGCDSVLAGFNDHKDTKLEEVRAIFIEANL